MVKTTVNLIILLVLCFSVPNAYSDEEQALDKEVVEEKKTDSKNAAEAYFKAFSLMKYPEPDQDAGAISHIMIQGWKRHGSKKLEKAIEENEECYAEFNRGVSLETCDFTYGIPRAYRKETDSIFSFDELVDSCLGRFAVTAHGGDYIQNIPPSPVKN